MRLGKMLALAVGLALGASLIASAPESDKISPRVLAKVKAKAKLSALVLLKKKASLEAATELVDRTSKAKFVYEKLSEVARESQVDLVAFLQTKQANFQRFHIVNMIALYDADAALILEVADRADVERVISNEEFLAVPPVDKTGPSEAKSEGGIEGSLISIGADKVWSDFNTRGEGIVVAGQDTGVEWDHPALKKQYRGYTSESEVQHDFHWHDAIHEAYDSGENPCGLSTTEPCDDNGHGTHTIGTVAGSDGAANRIGVAPGAKWIACRNMERGLGRPSSYIECFEWFLAPYAKGADPMVAGRPELAPHVINNSWGCPPSEGCREAEILPVLEALYSAGIMVVASAGNDGSGCSTIKDPPAMHSAMTLSVGAHNHRTGEIASFSSRGPSRFDGEVGPDVTAPGVSIRSAVPGGGYSGAMWSGTSMAGPHVAGIVALIWAAKPELAGDIESTVQLVRTSSSEAFSNQRCGGVEGSARPNNTFGYGRVNAYRAVQTALTLNQ